MKFEEMINTIQLGDCYELIKQIPDKSIDLVYIDIPYLYCSGGAGNSELCNSSARKKASLMGTEKQYLEAKAQGLSTSESLRIAKNSINKNMTFTNIENGIDYKIFDELCRVMKHIHIYIWCSKMQLLDIMKYFIEEKGCLFEIITWHKTNPMPTTNNSWLPDTEYCLTFREPSVTKLNDGIELKKKWYVSSLNVADKKHWNHPTIKPLELVKNHILHSSQPNDIALACFCGSGTTCVGAKETGRRFIGIEIDENYWKSANNRLKGMDDDGQLSIFADFENL